MQLQFAGLAYSWGIAPGVSGFLSFGAVLCLHFPQLLTVPQFRSHYPMHSIRTLIQGLIVGAGAFGILSSQKTDNTPLHQPVPIPVDSASPKTSWIFCSITFSQHVTIFENAIPPRWLESILLRAPVHGWRKIVIALTDRFRANSQWAQRPVCVNRQLGADLLLVFRTSSTL